MLNNNEPKVSAEERTLAARRDRIFQNNPVVMQGLGLAPLVVVNTTVMDAIVLSIAAVLLLVSTRVVAAVLVRFTHFRFRVITYALTASVLYAGVYFVLINLFTGAQIAAIGLYLPMLVVDPIIIKRYENPRKETVSSAWKKGVRTALGYALVLLLTGALREVFGLGTFYGVQVFKTAPFPLFCLPAGGFILLALFISLWRSVVHSLKKQMNLMQGVK